MPAFVDMTTEVRSDFITLYAGCRFAFATFARTSLRIAGAVATVPFSANAS
jgi:hypothetical protein